MRLCQRTFCSRNSPCFYELCTLIIQREECESPSLSKRIKRVHSLFIPCVQSKGGGLYVGSGIVTMTSCTVSNNFSVSPRILLHRDMITVHASRLPTLLYVLLAKCLNRHSNFSLQMVSKHPPLLSTHRRLLPHVSKSNFATFATLRAHGIMLHLHGRFSFLLHVTEQRRRCLHRRRNLHYELVLFITELIRKSNFVLFNSKIPKVDTAAFGVNLPCPSPQMRRNQESVS